MSQVRRPGMNDVARIAGVSHQTVSRVLNEHPNVSERTRSRVQEAIAQLGYRRNTAARSLVTNKTKTIGVLLFESTLFGPSNTFFGLQAAARSAGFFVTVAATAGFRNGEITEAVDYFLDQNVEAIVLIPPTLEHVRIVRELVTDVPLVIITSAELTEEGNTRVVRVDHYEGARLAVRHLVSQGYTRIGHIQGPDRWVDAHRRCQGYLDELASHDIEAGPIVVADNWEPSSGYHVVQHMLHDSPDELPVDALFAANDLIALGAMRGFNDANLRVPEDVAVMGYDNISGSDYFFPGLSSISLDYLELGRRALDRVLAAIHPTKVGRGQHENVLPELIVRQSTEF